MYLGYNTNGMANHRLSDAIQLLADLGYEGVAITIDHCALNPFDSDLGHQLAQVDQQLANLGMRSVIETGARFLLDPRRKHEPTLLTPSEEGRRRRVWFLKSAIDIAACIGSDCVSLWSGVPRDAADEDELWDRLTEGLEEVLQHAERQEVAIGFEPEPGMFIDTMAKFDELLARVDSPAMRLTLDIGHLHCQGETPIADVIEAWRDRLVNVHIEDMRAGVHDHLMFGEGEIDFPPIFEAFRNIDYQGGVYVELSRHSHMAPQAAENSMAYLRPMLR